MTKNYIVVVAPQQSGGWCAHFPDFPGCRAMGDRIEIAIENSSREVASWIDRAHEMPAPKSQEEVHANDAWAQQRGIDWSTAVVSFVNVDNS
jgi:predicted RNase H-like HicB family nuclease